MNPVRPRCGRLVPALVSLVLSAGPAGAGFPVPGPPLSTLPACVSACPGGDQAAITVIVRSFTGEVLPGALVVLDFCDCPGAILCPPLPNDGYTVFPPCHAVKPADVGGRAVFSLRMGGACAGSVRIYADGVLLGTRPLATTDQDGDLVVTGADLALQAAKIGGADLSGDLDCDGMVGMEDNEIIGAHLDHACVVATGARRTNWGEIKVRYR